MASGRRLYVKLSRDEAMRVTRASIKGKRLCYVILADKRMRYPKGRSPVVYIGTTKRGVGRVAGSAASKAVEVLSHRGIRSFTVRIITCQPRRNVRTWLKLERALLLVFKEKYGAAPLCNNHGRGMKPRDEFNYFQKRRLLHILDELR